MKLTNSEHRIQRYIELPDYLTLAGMLGGIVSIFASLEGYPAIATLLICFSIFCDFFDGRVARKMGREGDFGVQLDGFNDYLTSIIAVCAFGYSVGLQSPLAVCCMVIFCFGGALRLSRFAITGTVDGYYEGLPVTCGLAIPGAYWLSQLMGWGIGWLEALYAAGAFLMVSTIRVKKP
ncbi:MAG: CDP-alcohol phosphatidyltransferase family protein [Planctomycetota bacterium]|jgi:CDP-diacylglycerol--serine O-phosphatidyltransferase|nr:CDP-alcohol phosphatidyltransferase family protein [Planctomycetota bacterium]MDP6506748.1 CDP-alcohol phosphatidyltransferase family protein [Planctomycetota bacterium]